MGLRSWKWPSLVLAHAILPDVKPRIWPPPFSKKSQNAPSWIWPSDDFENRFGLSDGHIGSSVDQIRGSRTNSAARASWWVPFALGTSFSLGLVPHEKIQN